MNTPSSNHRLTKAVIHRLSRIEGHVRSIKSMIEEGRDCSDVLIQIAAVRSAINKVGLVVLEDHIDSCLVDAAEGGDTDEVWLDLKTALDVFL